MKYQYVDPSVTEDLNSRSYSSSQTSWCTYLREGVYTHTLSFLSSWRISIPTGLLCFTTFLLLYVSFWSRRLWMWWMFNRLLSPMNTAGILGKFPPVVKWSTLLHPVDLGWITILNWILNSLPRYGRTVILWFCQKPIPLFPKFPEIYHGFGNIICRCTFTK